MSGSEVAEDRLAWLGHILGEMSVGAAVVTGPLHLVEHANALAVTFAGGADLPGRPVTDLVSGPDREVLIKAIAEVQATGEPATVSGFRIPPAGSDADDERFLTLTFQPLTTSGGEEDAVLVTMLDCTAERSMQRQLQTLYEREHRVAETLQRSLLPAGPSTVAGLAVSARYVPGSAGSAVAGDWYEVFALPDGLVGLALGDVAGRGITAAAAMGRLRTALRAFALDGAGPVRVFECVNRLLGAYGGGDMASVIYGVFDPSTRNLRIASAGQPPPIVISADGTVRALELFAAPPLGVWPFPYTETVVSLPAGTTLLLYTDGLIDRRDDTMEDALTRLSSAIPTFAGDLDELCDGLLRNLDADTAPDDVALLAVSPTPLPAEPLDLTLPAVAQAVPALRRALSRWLLDSGATPDEAYDVTLAADEAATNVFEHAYPHEPGVFEVEGTIREGEVHVTVRDFGEWRPPGPGRARGLGLALMEGLMDEVELAPNPDGTEVRIRARLGAERRSETAQPPVPAEGGVPVLYCADRDIGAENAETLAKLVLAAGREGLPGVVLDLSDVERVDSAGLRLFFSVAERLESRGQHLSLVVPPDSPLRRLLLSTDLPRVIPLARSVAEADAFLRSNRD